MFRENQRVETFSSASRRFEATLECAGGAFGLGVFLSRTIDRSVGQADHHTPYRSQYSRGLGCPNPALILAQSDVQTMVEAAFDDPVSPLE